MILKLVLKKINLSDMERNKDVFDKLLESCKNDVYHAIRILSGFLDSDNLRVFVDDVILKLYSNET